MVPLLASRYHKNKKGRGCSSTGSYVSGLRSVILRVFFVEQLYAVSFSVIPSNYVPKKKNRFYVLFYSVGKTLDVSNTNQDG